MTAELPGKRRIRDLGVDKFALKLQSGLNLQLGPFKARISLNQDSLVNSLFSLYQDYALVPDESVFSFHARLDACRNPPRLHKKLVRFTVDGRKPHEDMPAEQALAVLEWGLNLVIALRSHQYLMLHSAVVELEGTGMLLPAAPGSGKTTLCTGLSMRGWRLLSDEFGLLRPGTTRLIPVPRPMALKNESIDVIRRFASDAVIGPEIPNTRKGTVAHVKPPTESILRSDETADARWIVFPRWAAGANCTLEEISRAEGFMFLATNAFNYELLGESAFDTVKELINQSRCFHLEYSNLDDAIAMLTDLVRHHDY